MPVHFHRYGLATDSASAGKYRGGLAHFSTFRGNDRLKHGNTDVIHCQPGDIVEVKGPGAGGFGLPAERDSAAVLHDVRSGFVRIAAARKYYGVVIENDSVQEEATFRLHASMMHCDISAAFDS